MRRIRSIRRVDCNSSMDGLIEVKNTSKDAQQRDASGCIEAILPHAEHRAARAMRRVAQTELRKCKLFEWLLDVEGHLGTTVDIGGWP